MDDDISFKWRSVYDVLAEVQNDWSVYDVLADVQNDRSLKMLTTMCDIVVSIFKLQSFYYVLFRSNTLGKGMKPLIITALD